MDASRTAWPGLGESPSSALSDLGIARGRLGSAMPQDVTHVRHGRPGVQELGRQRVPEARGPLPRGCKAGALQRSPHHRTESDRVGAATLRGLHAEADASGRTAWSHVGERGHESRADVLGEGETVAPSPCAADEQCARLPIPSIERQRDACTRSQAETSHAEHHGVIARAGGMVWMATLEQPRDLRGRHRLRHGRHAPSCHRRESRREGSAHGTPLDEQTAQGAPGTHAGWGVTRTARGGLSQETLGHLVDSARMQHERAGTNTLLEQTPHHGARVCPGDDGETPLSGQGVVKGMCEHVERAFVSCGTGAHPGGTHLREDRPQGDTVMPGRSALLLAVLENLAHTMRVKRVRSHVVLLAPWAPGRDQPQLLLGCAVRVPLLRASPSTPVAMGFQGASWPRLRGQGSSTDSNGHRGLLLQGVSHRSGEASRMMPRHQVSIRRADVA
jgi:hypothetical protein